MGVGERRAMRFSWKRPDGRSRRAKPHSPGNGSVAGIAKSRIGGPDGGGVVPRWNSVAVAALRESLRFGVSEFARRLGVPVEVVARWERLDRPVPLPLPAQTVLDRALLATDPYASARFRLLLADAYAHAALEARRGDVPRTATVVALPAGPIPATGPREHRIPMAGAGHTSQRRVGVASA